MYLQDISILRFKNQQIAGSKFKTAREVVDWMGAIQAQDFNMSKWALGIRIQDSTETMINKSIDSGDLIRAHLLRPTWHFVSAGDFHWIRELTASRIKAATRFRDKELGLTDAIFSKSNKIIEKSLRNGDHLTRDEIIKELEKAGTDLGNNRASHILIHAETDGIICSGRLKGTKPTYTLQSDWIPNARRLNRGEALKELAQKYFNSHGPATLSDFTWWSGLSSDDSKIALESVKPELQSEIIDNQTYWFTNDTVATKTDPRGLFLLPAYDEFIISYRDRTASLNLSQHKKAVSDNGIFYPLIVMNGKVIGTWKRIMNKDKVVLKPDLFLKVDPGINALLSGHSTVYAKFIGKKVEIESL